MSELKEIYEKVAEVFPERRIKVQYDKRLGYQFSIRVFGLSGIEISTAWWPVLNIDAMISELRAKGKTVGVFR